MTHYDRPTLILAIILACFLWTYVRVAQENRVTRIIRDVQIQMSGKGATLAYTLSPVDHVEITIKGPADLVNNVSRDEVEASIDVAGIANAGTTSVPVRVRVPRGITLVGKPSNVAVITDTLKQKMLPVKVAFLAIPSPGATVGEYLVEPTLVAVQGTPEVLKQVTRVIVLIDPNEPPGAGSTYIPRAVNSSGERVVDASVLQSSVKVRMASLTGEQVTRTVAVRPPNPVNPPPGYTVTVGKIQPDVVTLSGESSTLDRQPAYLETGQLDVHTVTRDTTLLVKLRVPTGLKIVEGPQVNVDLHVQPQK